MVMDKRAPPFRQQLGVIMNDDGGLSTKATIGVGVGALAAGVLIGTVSAYLFFVRRREQWDSPDLRRKSLEPLDPNMLGLNHPHSPSPGAHTRSSAGRWGPYDVEPFVLPPHDTSAANTTLNSHNTNANVLSPTSAGPGGPLSPSPYGTSSGRQTPTASAHGDRTSIATGSQSQSPPGTAADSLGRRVPTNPGGGANASHVYVVHHDAGRPPPVTVFTSDGTEVVELPPQYESAAQAQGAQGSSGAPVLQPPPPGGPRRQPRGLPAKTARVASNGDQALPS
uniref:Type III effector protein AvrBs2 n=1 Tax=Ganoderma boninense TaxID=34458 RepID=A0A5K1K7Z7_9APHY|nr:Type III effector protein AvrBs2 [Ganoderma boninense]